MKNIRSGLYDIATDLNKDFDPNANLETWSDEYMPASGKANTVGGEIVRAVERILYRWWNDGDKIGRGYGKETCNPPARYIIETCPDFEMVDDLERFLEGDRSMPFDDNGYDTWQESFKKAIENYLRSHPELFKKVNNEDMWDYADSSEDRDNSISDFYAENREGTIQYDFTREDDDHFTCTAIELTGSEYEVGDIFNEDDVDDTTEEYGSVEIDGIVYEYEAIDEADEDGYYHEYEVTEVRAEDEMFYEGELTSVDDIEYYYDNGDINLYHFGSDIEPKDLM